MDDRRHTTTTMTFLHDGQHTTERDRHLAFSNIDQFALGRSGSSITSPSPGRSELVRIYDSTWSDELTISIHSPSVIQQNRVTTTLQLLLNNADVVPLQSLWVLNPDFVSNVDRLKVGLFTVESDASLLDKVVAALGP